MRFKKKTDKKNRPRFFYLSYSQVPHLLKREMHPETNQKRRSLVKKRRRRKTRGLHFSHTNKRRSRGRKGR